MPTFPSAVDLGYLLLVLIGFSIPLRIMAGQKRKVGLLVLSLTGIFLIGSWTNGRSFAFLLLGGLSAFWLANWTFACLIQKTSGNSRHTRFAIGIILNILALTALHFCDQQTAMAKWPWQKATNGLSLLYLLGTPFLLLNALSYLWDVHRGRIAANILDCGLYFFYLPKMPAGPVMSPRPFARTLTQRPGALTAINDYGYGLMHIGFGFFSSEVLCSFIIDLIMPVLKASGEQGTFGRADALAAVFGLGLATYFALAGMASTGRGISLLFGVALPGSMRKPLLAPNILAFTNRWLVGVAGILRRLILRPFETAPLATRLVLIVLCALCGGLLFGIDTNHLLLGSFLAVTILLFVAWRKWIAPLLAHLAPAPQTEMQARLTGIAALSLVLLLLLPRVGMSFLVLIVIIGSWHGFIKVTRQTSWKEVFKTIAAWFSRILAHLVTLTVAAFSAMLLTAPTMQLLRSLVRAVFCSKGLALPTALGTLINLYKKTWFGMVFPVNPIESNDVLIYNQGIGVLSLILLLFLTFWTQKQPALTSRQAVTWHSIAFGFSIYFLVAWRFAGPAPVWPGLWR